ncbi:hypothetical protein ASG73_10995 [Janibacter sp. Soil728]|uniref:DUF6504 family protein n=1 Tax=Janibacter sp. Soil728 TaxID=1736393 RepID=UPI0006F45DFD|nr:DUF6504 family protein [Janibacter sp. Soil728]KRE36854.1 hypothetical protein ASG73_10995 [Janibacter sp. Soil728]
MVRLVEEAIEVRVAETRPEQFLWRGRLYRVTEVVDHWQERRAWWRATDGQSLSQVPLARDVWRVSASRGRSGTPGVYDLGVDGGSSGASDWLLLRTQD